MRSIFVLFSFFLIFYVKSFSKKSTYPILVDLLRTTTSKNISFLPVKRDNGIELGHHFYYMAKAQINNWIYCPAPKGTLHDGCLYDPISNQIVEFAQFKFSRAGTSLNYDCLQSFVQKKYFYLDTLMYGFETTKDFLLHNPTLMYVNETKISLNSSLTVFGEDLSIYTDSTRINVPHMQELILRQLDCHLTVINVNNFIKKNIHSGLDYTNNRFLGVSDGKLLELVEPTSLNSMFSEVPNFFSSNPDALELANQASYMF